MAKIFISYRRRDNAHAAGRLYSELRDLLGARNIFMDVDDIPPGLDFVEILEQKVSRCRVLLAVIGRDWLSARDDSGRLRLWNELDFVRVEIAAALNRDIPVVPVLFEGVLMPAANELPAALQGLIRRQAVSISHENFGSDTRKLAQRLKPEIGWSHALKRRFLGGYERSEKSSTHHVVERIEPKLDASPNVSERQSKLTAPQTSVERFFHDVIRSASGKSVTATQMYESYCNWCENNSIDPLALPSFGREFTELGVKRERIAGRVRYLNVSLE